MAICPAGLPPAPGSYALWLRLPGSIQLSVGRMGTFSFPAGDYLYLGSAFGPGGLRARLLHHARISAKPHWHLDALRPHALFLGGWYCTNAPPLECAWSLSLAALPGVQAPAPGFGASDCRQNCPAHLLALPSGADLADVEDCLQAAAAGEPVIRFSA